MNRIYTPYAGVTRRTVLRVAVVAAAGQALDLIPGLASAIPAAEAAAAITLNNFLTLSSLLTGVENLDPDVGKVYFETLQANAASRKELADLLRRSGMGSANPAKTLNQLAATGVFQNKALRTVADTITEYWFTGTYDSQGGPRVAAWTGALAWTTTYTKAMGLCGGPTGYWAAKPRSA